MPITNGTDYDHIDVKETGSDPVRHMLKDTEARTRVGSLEDDVEDLKSAIDTKAPAIWEDASGAIASFSDGAEDMPIKSLAVGIEPVQDLHGYDSPWPAGGGKNIMPPFVSESRSGVTLTVDGTGKVTLNGTASEDVYFDLYVDLPVKSGEFFYLGMFNPVTGNTRISLFMLTNKIGNPQCNANVVNSSTSANAQADANVTGFRIRAPSGVALNNFVCYPYFQVGGSAPTSWTPYSNICPITGWTGANVSRTGKNLFDVNALRPGNFDTAADYPFGNVASAEYVPLKPGQYTWSQLPYGVSGGKYARFYNANKEQIGTVSIYSDKPYTITAPEGTCYCRFMLYRSTNQFTSLDDVLALKPMVELGTSASSYEPYSGHTYDIEFPSEAGTVYGGTLVIHQDGTGSLVVDRAEVDMGTLTYTRMALPAPVTGSSYVFRAISFFIKAKSTKCVGSEYPYIGSYIPLGTHDKAIGYIYESNICVRDDDYIDATDFKTAMTGVQLVYELATPITYTLTPIEVRTLLGVNNILADTGDVSVDYQADTKLYIDNKITAAVAAALNS